MVLTIGLLDEPVVKRKGLDVFVKATRHLKDVRFILICSGKDGYNEQLKKMAAPNVEFAGWVDHHDLHGYYQRAKVYCQLSVSEGLPNALCEAMWKTSVPIQDVGNEVKKLKEQARPELQVHGSGNLIQTLLRHDLVDELWLKIFPVVLGSGKRLFAEGTIPAGFKLLESSVSPGGVIVASYARAGEVKTGLLGI